MIKSTAIDPRVVGRRRRLSQGRARRACSHASADAIAAIKSGPDPGGRYDGADRPRADGHRHGRDLPAHLRAQASAVRQAGGRDHRRALLRRLAPAPASATSARKRWPAGRSAKCGTATGSGSSSTATGWKAAIDLVGRRRRDVYGPRKARACWPRAPPHPDLAPDPALPDDTRLWAALQQAGGGTWGGCVYDVDAILGKLGVRSAECGVRSAE